VVVAILLIVSVPVYAQAQSPSAAKLSKGDAEKVVTIINGDKAKTKAYCDMDKLAKEIEEAHKRKDGKTITESYQKIETLEKTLGPEYAALIVDRWASGHRERRGARSGVFVRSRSTQQALYEVGLKNSTRAAVMVKNGDPIKRNGLAQWMKDHVLFISS